MAFPPNGYQYRLVVTVANFEPTFHPWNTYGRCQSAMLSLARYFASPRHGRACYKSSRELLRQTGKVRTWEMRDYDVGFHFEKRPVPG